MLTKLKTLSESSGELRYGGGPIYGVLGDYVADGFLKQLRFPFVWKE